MPFLYLIISILIFHLLIKTFRKKINFKKSLDTYIQSINYLIKSNSKSEFTKFADEIANSGIKLLLHSIIYFLPCLPIIYILKKHINLTYFVSFFIVSFFYIFYFQIFRNE